jgi:hypothetical protein
MAHLVSEAGAAPAAPFTGDGRSRHPRRVFTTDRPDRAPRRNITPAADNFEARWAIALWGAVGVVAVKPGEQIVRGELRGTRVVPAELLVGQ